MIKTEDIIAVEKALEKVSDSIELFKRFVVALNAFLLKHGFGSAELVFDPNPELYDRGYGFARFYIHLCNGKDLLYADLYTNGTATGENFSNTVWARQQGGINGSWYGLIRDVIKEVGHGSMLSQLPREKIEKIIEMLG